MWFTDLVTYLSMEMLHILSVMVQICLVLITLRASDYNAQSQECITLLALPQ
jgi:hypothetical protein